MMLEMIYSILFITGILLIIFCAAQYLRTRTDYRSGPLYRALSLLLYGYLKVCSAIGYGLEYIGRKIISILCDYHTGDDRLTAIYQKEQQRSHRNGCENSSAITYGRKNYKLKILK